MAGIVGAACQPLQPEEPVAAPARTATATTGGSVRAEQGAADQGRTPAAVAPAPEAAIPSTPLVALFVPLSGRQESLGAAVRDGFIAAHLEAPESARFETLIIDEARVSAMDAHRQALAAGARVFVGPLLKESVQAIAPLVDQLGGQMPVLALNNLADGDAGSNALWQFGLAPEDEARQVADRAVALGQRRAIALIPASGWGQRLLDAFASELAARGGVLVEARTYLPGSPDYSAEIRGLLQTVEPDPKAIDTSENPDEKPSLAPRRREDVDLIFVATNRSNGRQIVPQLKFFGGGDLPTYSTSAIWEDGNRRVSDLNGVIFPDSPWVIAPDSRAIVIKKDVVRYWGRGALGASRLFALGYDAYRLLPHILRQPLPGPFRAGEIPGNTGKLYADSAGRIHRRLEFATIRNGRPEALPPPGQASILRDAP
jgi:outer membrane PBP1 activator LpoA protein